ncbi:hypothetical protein K1T71_013664 [Dendrolimus kikuchii]|uniref:Uncharacterized protein n=1 Tax=Dendrolimus kikuchii TaxID=765133 RepID=A0ACC1CHF9_9NEOP|nr:hypothetical protein K1T71_013664 [Dendrolimus kikuchii]
MDLIESYSESDCESTRTSKRPCSDMEEGWNVVKGKKDRRHSKNSMDTKIEVYISHNERLPKQFAMAKILQEHSISNVKQVKYVNPFKIRLEFENETAVKNLMECEPLIAKGWRFQKAMELLVIYGVLKDVDFDTPDDEILSSITCPPPAKLLSFIRLNRRDGIQGGWRPSETLRLCFEGDYLPNFVRIYDVNVRVFPYIHRVSQCSQCWKLGHNRKTCPKKKVICPKCGDQHENCTTTTFRCVNCNGNHISMSRSCPVYKKERKLREVMAERRCTYRKALEQYSSSKNPYINQAPVDLDNQNAFPPLRDNLSTHMIESTPEALPKMTYSEAFQTKTVQNVDVTSKHIEQPVNSRRRIIKRKIERRSEVNDWLSWINDPQTKTDNTDSKKESTSPKNFRDLLYRLKEVIFLQEISVSSKIEAVIQLCLEWFIIMVRDYFSEWPWVKVLLNLFTQSP